MKTSTVMKSFATQKDLKESCCSPQTDRPWLETEDQKSPCGCEHGRLPKLTTKSNLLEWKACRGRGLPEFTCQALGLCFRAGPSLPEPEG